MYRIKRLVQVVLAGALLTTALAVPAPAQEDATPILESAEFRSGVGHELGYFESTDRPLTVVVGSDPALGDNTYGYLRVRYLKWNRNKSRWVPMRRSGEFPKGWSRGHWNSDIHKFEAPFVRAAKRGKCKLVAKYADHQTDLAETKDKKVFRCGRGFGAA